MSDPETFLTVAEIAELLKLNPQTVRNWIDRGDLSAVRVGSRRVRVKQSDLGSSRSGRRWCQSATQKPGSANQAEAAEDELRDQLGVALDATRSALDDRKLVAALNALTEAARGLAQAQDAARRERSIR